MKQFFGKKSRTALATVFLVSLALHVVAVLIFGTIKFVSEVLREETVFEAAPIVPPPQKEPEYTVNLQQRNQSIPPPRPPAIVVNNPSELDIPALDIDVNISSSSVYGRSGGGFGGGLASVREMAISANLFGMSVTAENLGVVLDVSASAHGYLDKAIAEIDKNFPEAQMIMVIGCGMSEVKNSPEVRNPIAVPYRNRDSNEYNNLGPNSRAVLGQLKGFFKRLGEPRGQEMQQYFKNRKNLYVLFGGGIHATNYAFDDLIRNNADTIYWFADFADRVDQPVADRLTSDLKRKSIKLIAHNFMGKPVKPEVKEMARATGGSTLEVVPGE